MRRSLSLNLVDTIGRRDGSTLLSGIGMAGRESAVFGRTVSHFGS